jgi:plastocyanin
MRARPSQALAVLAVGVVATACGGSDSDADLSTRPPSTEASSSADAGESMTIVGEDIMFDTTELTATAGQELEITFDNRDDGVQHNLHVRDTTSGDAMTEITEGPITQTLDVTFDQPGEFEYLCDVHPNDMTGTITVS